MYKEKKQRMKEKTVDIYEQIIENGINGIKGLFRKEMIAGAKN